MYIQGSHHIAYASMCSMKVVETLMCSTRVDGGMVCACDTLAYGLGTSITYTGKRNREHAYIAMIGSHISVHVLTLLS